MSTDLEKFKKDTEIKTLQGVVSDLRFQLDNIAKLPNQPKAVQMQLTRQLNKIAYLEKTY